MPEKLFSTLLRHARTTKGTFQYLEPGETDADKTIRNIYIRKPVVRGEAPGIIRVTVESVDREELGLEALEALGTIRGPTEPL